MTVRSVGRGKRRGGTGNALCPTSTELQGFVKIKGDSVQGIFGGKVKWKVKCEKSPF